MKAKKKGAKGKAVLVTGGAGFIGSHLVDSLMKAGAQVSVLDNLSNGSLKNVGQWLSHRGFRFLEGDLLNKQDAEIAIEGCMVVYHLAANPEVKLSAVAPDFHFRQNVVATYNVLESYRKSETAESFVFTSSSTVYGDASVIPTPEDYAPLEPISVYGASKLASEALITAYAHTYGFKAVIYRLANIIGSRSIHGVVYDFISKLRKNPRRLEILGDGTQAKSYLHVDDCVEAMLSAPETPDKPVEVFNLGSEDWVTVKSIGEIVAEEMDLENVAYSFTGGVDGGRGWKGDVKYMRLAIDKLKVHGWKPKLSSAQAVKTTAQSILKELK